MKINDELILMRLFFFKDLQIGVKALIIISITVVLGVLIYNVVYQV